MINKGVWLKLKKVDDRTIKFESREEVRAILSALTHWRCGHKNSEYGYKEVDKLAALLGSMKSANFWRNHTEK